MYFPNMEKKYREDRIRAVITEATRRVETKQARRGETVAEALAVARNLGAFGDRAERDALVAELELMLTEANNG